MSAAGHVVVAGDLTIPEVRTQFVEAAIQAYGRVDVLVNNAGVGLYANPTTTSLDLARRLFEVNVFTPLALAQLVAPVMRRQRSGAIVNVGSVGGHVALPWAAIYCASKFALHSLSDSLYRELKSDGVHVAKVCPGIVRTDFRAHVLAGEAPGKVEAIRRTVSPKQVAVTIADSIAFERTLSYVPQVGRLFRALDFFAPTVMDWFLGMQARRADEVCRDGNLAELP